VNTHNGPVAENGEPPKRQDERLKLLESIETNGSISAAARDLGISYRTAWDRAQALNTLFGRPLIEARAGGRAGGSAALTDEGRAALRAIALMNGELEGAMNRLARRLCDDPAAAALVQTWSFPMRTSARNALRGRITEIRRDAVEAEVTLELSPGVEVTAMISARSADDLGLAVGGEATALIKASMVVLASGDGLAYRTSARNALSGTVASVEAGEVTAEVVLDLGQGRTLTATLTTRSVEALGLTVGSPAIALVKAPHVILAVE
jgi:molybdate transport system regulatory protein